MDSTSEYVVETSEPMPSTSKRLVKESASPSPIKFTIEHVAHFPGPKSILDMLRCCSQCGDMPPIGSYSCSKGHVTCLKCTYLRDSMLCHYKVDSTFHCGKTLTVASCHPFTAIFQGATMNCPENTCSAVLQGEQMYHHHEFYCRSTKRFCCAFSVCLSDDLYNQDSLLCHLISDHEIPLYRARHGMLSMEIDESSAFQVLGNWKVAFILQKDDAYFVCSYARELVNGMISVVVILYYFPKSPSKVYYGTTLLVGHKCTSQQEYTGILPSVLNSRRAVIQSFRCLVVPVEIVLPSNKFLLQVQIHDSANDVEECTLENFFHDDESDEN